MCVWQHAVTHDYNFESFYVTQVFGYHLSPKVPVSVLEVTFLGKTATSERSAIKIIAAVGPFVDVDTVVDLFGTVDIRRIFAIACNCAEYETYDGSLCRHGGFFPGRLADMSLAPVDRISFTKRLAPHGHISRNDFELADKAACTKAEIAIAEAEQAPMLSEE